jgi:hypothetical protein
VGGVKGEGRKGELVPKLHYLHSSGLLNRSEFRAWDVFSLFNFAYKRKIPVEFQKA